MTGRESAFLIPTATPTPRSPTFLTALSGEERPSRMLILLFILALSLHVWFIMWLLRPVQAPVTPAQPLMMEVSMLAMPAPKPSAAPPPPAPRPPEKKPPEKKTQPKPLPKPVPAPKKPPVTQKAPAAAPVEPAAEPLAAEPPPAAPSAPAQPSAVTDSKAAAATNAETFTEANFKAHYDHNPKPDYPSVAKSRGWQGKVMLRVKVSAEGLSEAVEVELSSGHEMLDESAVEAVKKWRFIPAKRGETAVASSVIVPIIFTLRD